MTASQSFLDLAEMGVAISTTSYVYKKAKKKKKKKKDIIDSGIVAILGSSFVKEL